jgi:hypothetical protein
MLLEETRLSQCDSSWRGSKPERWNVRIFFKSLGVRQSLFFRCAHWASWWTAAKCQAVQANNQHRAKKRNMSKIYCSVLSTKLHLIPRARLGPALGPTITWNLHTLSQCWLLKFLWSQSSKQILFWMHMPTMPCWERILSLPARLVQTPSNLGQWLKLIFGGYLFCLRMIILINWLDIFQPQNDVGHLATPAGVCLAAPPMYENCPTCAYQRLQ